MEETLEELDALALDFERQYIARHPGKTDAEIVMGIMLNLALTWHTSADDPPMCDTPAPDLSRVLAAEVCAALRRLRRLLNERKN